MRLAAICLVAGCWSTSAPPPVAPAPTTGVIVDGPAGVPVSRRLSRRDPIPRRSVWEGTYVCNQGLSSVTLTLESDRFGNATARYDFGPVPTNPTVPTGAYALSGTLRVQEGGGFTGELEAIEWIHQPANYFMVPLAIETGDGKTMTGTIRHPSCRDFQTRRIE